MVLFASLRKLFFLNNNFVNLCPVYSKVKGGSIVSWFD